MNRPHWDYYLTVMDDLREAARFVEFTSSNFGTHSLEFVRIILAVGSEVDVVAKVLCEQIKPKETARNIDDYRRIITEKHPSLTSVEITAPKYGVTFTPWCGWEGGQNPKWWTSYNNVKHHRNTYYADASLENVLLGAAGLCALLGYLYAEFFASNYIQRPLLFFDDNYALKPLILTGRHFKLP
jgi:hypothetical protein